MAAGIVRAVQEWLPGIEPNDLEFIRLLLLEGDPEKLWHCRVYRYDDGRTYFYRDVGLHTGQELHRDATEHTLLGMVQEARQAVRLALPEPVGRD